jgi:hypothetical protein
MAIQVAVMNERWAGGALGNVVVTSWNAKLTVEDVMASERLGDETARQFPNGYGAIAIVGHGIPMPGPETRRLIAEVTQKTSARTVAQVTILEGEGFWASTARLVLASMNLASQAQAAVRVSPDADDAAQFVLDRLGQRLTVDVPTLAAAVRAFRAQHIAHAPLEQKAWARR